MCKPLLYRIIYQVLIIIREKKSYLRTIEGKICSQHVHRVSLLKGS